jgi:hypothetical protein
MKRHPSGQTLGDWRVARDLVEEEAEANGRVVVCGSNLIADCRNDFLPEMEQRANAEACAVAKEAIGLLVEVESYLGDLPARDRAASKLHRAVVSLLLEVSKRAA